MKYLTTAALCLWMSSFGGCGPSIGERKPPIPDVHPPAYNDANALLLWLSLVSILGFGACVAAGIFLPTKKLAVAGAAGFASMLALALTTKAALPYLSWVALALGIIAAVCGIWYFRKYVMAMRSAVAFGNDMTQAETFADAEAVKHTHQIVQQVRGVHDLIANEIHKSKKKKVL